MVKTVSIIGKTNPCDYPQGTFFQKTIKKMAEYKGIGDAAMNVAEECAEVIQIISKVKRFDNPEGWQFVNPETGKTRLQELQEEMGDVMYAFERFLNQLNK